MASNNKINMREIAQMLGISAATVSRALRTPEKVKPETLEKILNLTQELDYTPRPTTIFSERIITYLVTDIGNPFYAEMLKQLTVCAKEAGYYLLACNTNNDQDTESTMMDYFTHLGYSGIIISGLTSLQTIHADVPVILLSSADYVEGNYYSIYSDSRSAIKLLTDYLVKLGHRKIAFIAGRDHSSATKERSDAFLSYMGLLGLEVPEAYIFPGNFDIQSGLAAFDYFYSLLDAPTAIIAANDEMAKGFIIRANSLGVRIPEDISICGIDAISGDTFLPKITSIHQDIEAIAHKCISIVQQGAASSVRHPIVFPVEFSPGNTCYRLQSPGLTHGTDPK